MHAETHKHMHACRHRHRHTHFQTHAHTHQTHKCARTRKHAETRKHMHAYKHTRTHKQKYMHINKDRHTHALLISEVLQAPGKGGPRSEVKLGGLKISPPPHTNTLHIHTNTHTAHVTDAGWKFVFIHPFICLLVHLFIYRSKHASIHLSTCWSVYLNLPKNFHPFTCLLCHLSTHHINLFICLPVCPLIYRSNIHPIIGLTVGLLIFSFQLPSICLSLCPSFYRLNVHSFISAPVIRPIHPSAPSSVSLNFIELVANVLHLSCNVVILLYCSVFKYQINVICN